MLGTIIGIGAAAGKAIANNNAKNEQKKENRKLMKYQADLNQQQAYYSTGVVLVLVLVVGAGVVLVLVLVVGAGVVLVLVCAGIS